MSIEFNYSVEGREAEVNGNVVRCFIVEMYLNTTSAN